MRSLRGPFCGALVTLLLAGCGSSSSDPIVVTPPPPPTTDFTSFVKGQFAATSDLTDPMEVDDKNFVFQDEDNPSAFDDLLQ